MDFEETTSADTLFAQLRYTENVPTSDAQVAAHFSTQRPVLGICLKRYSFTPEGCAVRRGTYVDIPLEIAIPKFVGDDQGMAEDGPLFGNFRLVLQSVVCHRGVSVTSGHYITLTRGQAANASGAGMRDLEDESEDPWMRFDDLARERVVYVDIETALREETPYLLFYQIQPFDDGVGGVGDEGLPSYAEAMSRAPSDCEFSEKPLIFEEGLGLDGGLERVGSCASEALDGSLDISTALGEGQRGRTSTDARRRSIALTTEGSVATDGSVPSTPIDEPLPATISGVGEGEGKSLTGLLGVLTRGERRGSRNSHKEVGGKSRPSSTDGGGGNRFSFGMRGLQGKKSKGDMGPPPPPLGALTMTAREGEPLAMPAATTRERDMEGETPRQSSSAEGLAVVTVQGDDGSGSEPGLSRPTSDESTGGEEGRTEKGKWKMTKEEKVAAKIEKKNGRKGKGGLQHHHHYGNNGAEDRDCVLM